MDSKAVSYARRGHKSVHGWLTKEAAMAIIALDAVEKQLHICGGACEIGVHHGRLFILLCMLLRDTEHALGIDLFDLQDQNVDASGYGNAEQLRVNMQRFGVTGSMLEQNSMRVTAADVREVVGAVRLFSVDGGHTAEITRNDLAIAEASLCNGGLILLDDYLSPHWPGVTEGACEFMATSELNPVGYVSNKLILCKGSSEEYRRALPGVPIEMFDRPAILAGTPPLRKKLAQTELWSRMRNGPIGALVRALAQ